MGFAPTLLCFLGLLLVGAGAVNPSASEKKIDRAAQEAEEEVSVDVQEKVIEDHAAARHPEEEVFVAVKESGELEAQVGEGAAVKINDPEQEAEEEEEEKKAAEEEEETSKEEEETSQEEVGLIEEKWLRTHPEDEKLEEAPAVLKLLKSWFQSHPGDKHLDGLGQWLRVHPEELEKVEEEEKKEEQNWLRVHEEEEEEPQAEQHPKESLLRVHEEEEKEAHHEEQKEATGTTGCGGVGADCGQKKATGTLEEEKEAAQLLRVHPEAHEEQGHEPPVMRMVRHATKMVKAAHAKAKHAHSKVIGALIQKHEGPILRTESEDESEPLGPPVVRLAEMAAKKINAWRNGQQQPPEA